MEIVASKNAERNLRVISWCCVLSGFLVGYATSSINGATLFIIREMELQPAGIGLLSSAFEIGAAAGSLLSGTFADKFGRKRTHLVAHALYIVAIGVTVGASNLALLVLGRALQGVAAGGIYVIGPVLLAEFCTPDVRAQKITTFQLIYSGGEASVFIVAAVLGNIWFDNVSVWRWIYLLAFIPAVPLLILHAIFVPESHRWLAKMGCAEESLQILQKIRRTPAEIDMEMREIDSVLHGQQSSSNPSAGHAKKSAGLCDHLSISWIRKVLLLGVGIAMVQQGNGVSVVMKLGTFMLGESGLSAKMALILNTSIGLVALASMWVGLLLVSRVPLRRMTLISGVGVICAHLCIAVISTLLPQNLERGWITLGMLLIFIIFVMGSILPICNLIMNEIFPLEIRGFGKGVATLAAYLTACILDQMFPIFLNHLGQPTTFAVLAAIGVCAVFFTFCCLPETRGKSLEELEQLFKRGDWKALKEQQKPALANNNNNNNDPFVAKF